MSNFGFSSLRLVNPYAVAFREARSAMGGADILESAKEYKTVADAVADCSLVVGTTAVRHRELQHPLRTLADGARLIRSLKPSRKVALLFGSELKCLLQYPGFPREADLSAIHHYLTLQYVPDPLSALRHARKLPPAHRLVWEAGRITIDRYWELPYVPKWTIPEADLREQVRDKIERRLAKAQGMSDLTSTNVDTKMLEVEQAQASAEAQARLSELRSELGLTSPETEKPAPAPQPAEAEKPAEKPSS